MKKIIIKILLTVLIIGNIGFISNIYANEGESKGIKVVVTEKIPGASCGKEVKKIETVKNGKTIVTYEYEVGKGFSAVICIMGGIIKYFSFLAGLGGVLFIIINGIMYSMGGIDQSMKDESKKRIVGTIVGLVLLLLSGVILNLLFPWIYV